MKDEPDISIAAAMTGNPVRANMLLALISGLSLTAAELAPNELKSASPSTSVFDPGRTSIAINATLKTVILC